MQVTIEINGRQALPVRAIPLLTDWRGLSPDQLAQILAGDSDFWPSFDGLTAYRLNPDGSTEPTPPRWWASWVVRKLKAVSEAIEATQTSHETGYQQWRAQALAQLPAGVFVWRDEFEKAYVREYGPESLRARCNRKTFDPSLHALDFNPQPDPAIATQHLVMEGFVPISGAINQGRAQALEWLNAPREELPQEYHDAIAERCEVDAIDKQAKELETTQPVGVRLLVGGRNRKGQFVLTTFGTADNYQPDTQPARQGAYLIEGAASHTEIAPWLEREVKPDAPNWRSLDDVAHTLDACIAKMAEDDKDFLVHDYIRNNTPYIDIIEKLYPNDFQPTTLSGKRIDLVYMTEPLFKKVRSAEIIRSGFAKSVRDPRKIKGFCKPSDHYPIRVELKF